MKYPKITALVPEGEHFDDSAIINEGGYLSIAHFAAVEKRLTENETAIADAANALTIANNDATTRLNAANDEATIKLNAANELVTEANAAKKVSDDALIAANATIEAQQTEIENLKAENAKLKKEPGAAVSTTVTDSDVPPVGSDTKVPAHLNPNSSINKAADRMFMPKKKK